MLSFGMLNDIVRAFFALWALLLCLLNIANSVLSFTKRKYVFGVISIISFGLAYVLWQVIFDYSLLDKNGSYSPMTQVMVDIGWVYWLLIILFLTGGTTVLFIYNIHYERNNLTANSIKTYLDKVDCGVCCYKNNGRVLFSNIRMKELCFQITGSPLLNGNHFNESLIDDLMSIGEEKWRFSTRDIIINNENMHEIVATNVTNEYNKTQDLEKDKLELSRIKKELQDYNLSIDDMVKHQEILQAKINIHDEMNRLMLSSVATENPNELDNIFSLWQENALLLSKEVEANESEEPIKRIVELAKSLKMNLIWNKDNLSLLNDEQKGIFFQTAQEAIANASKHSNADEIVISIESTNESVECRFVNNGAIPQKEIVFTGGLSNLEKLVKKFDASIKTKLDMNQFTLILSFLTKK